MRVRIVALVLVLSMLPACWGYNSSSKGWSYVGNSVLIGAGGGAIALDRTSTTETCTGTGCTTYSPPFTGMLLAGVVLVASGLVGIVINASRTEVKSTR